jgi:type II secretion system protein G
MKKGVTVLEVLIVIIIIAILAAIAVPVYTNKIERTKGERAIASIELIADAIKMYQVKNNAYPSSASNTNITEINTNLNLELTDPNFTYSLSGMLPLYPINWQIIATRNSGSNTGKKLVLEKRASSTTENWAPTSNWPWPPS